MKLLYGIVAIALTFAHWPAIADGAFAVGSTGNAKDGIAMGGSTNYRTANGARERALKECHEYEAPKAAALCRVVATFKGECFASAFDPKPGTPGFGWGVASTKELAEERALENCRVTAGEARRRFCAVEKSVTRCDQSK